MFSIIIVDTDADGKLKYAKACFLYENYHEAANVSSEIPLMSNTTNETNQAARLLKGKALFYIYQPKVLYLMKYRQNLSRLEVKLLETETFQAIKETIQVLGHALDWGYLDSEGSKLLDWAMMDCIRETNHLNLCRRCLMCRASRNLHRSHIWPKFVLQQISRTQTDISESSKKFTFGLEKHQIKSAGECWFWMLCGHCEEIMSQNAENDFSVHFPKEITPQTVMYKGWLFNYCCAILLRTISFVKFPRCFNDSEIYYTFVYCRNHLLSLKVRIGEMEPDSTKHKPWQYCSKLFDLKPYIFIMPSAIVMQESNVIIQPAKGSCNWLAPHRLLDGCRDFSGFSHFFAACCSHVCIVIKYSPSSSCHIPERYEIAVTGGKYVIEDECDRVSSIPNGLWMLWNRMVLLDNMNVSGLMRELSTGAAKKLSSKLLPKKILLPTFAHVTLSENSDKPAVQVPHPMTSVKQMNFLPPEFLLTESVLYATQTKLKFPEGHQILCHNSFNESGQSLLCFLGIGSSVRYPSNKPYVIYIYSSRENKLEYIDGAFLTSDDKGEIQLSEYFLNHEVANAVRSKYIECCECVVYSLTTLLNMFGVGTLTTLLHYLKCRHDIKNIKGLPSFACKCLSSEDCWYCRDLCHYCLNPAASSCSLPNSTTIRYCSNLCLTLLCTNPSELSKSTLVFNHCIEGDKYSGISMLDILKIHRNDDPNVNQFELVHVCLESCSESPSDYKPYIIWQKRAVFYQIIFIFYISQDCEILSALVKDDQKFAATVTETIHRHENFLKKLISIAVQCLGYTKFSSFLSHYIKFLNKNKSLQGGHKVENTCVGQSEESVMLFVSVASLPKPKIVIPDHFIMGLSIVRSQFVEIKVDLSLSNDLHMDVCVTSPFQDQFSLQLQVVNQHLAIGQFIPAFSGDYILHFSLKPFSDSHTKDLDTLNVKVTVF